MRRGNIVHHYLATRGLGIVTFGRYQRRSVKTVITLLLDLRLNAREPQKAQHAIPAMAVRSKIFQQSLIKGHLIGTLPSI